MTAIPKKMLRNISLVLAIALLFALTAGCGAASATIQTTAAATTAVETTAAAITAAETTAASTVAPSEPKDPMGKYDPPIDVTFITNPKEAPPCPNGRNTGRQRVDKALER